MASGKEQPHGIVERLGTDLLESSSQVKDLGAQVDTRNAHKPAMCSSGQDGQGHPGVY